MAVQIYTHPVIRSSNIPYTSLPLNISSITCKATLHLLSPPTSFFWNSSHPLVIDSNIPPLDQNFPAEMHFCPQEQHSHTRPLTECAACWYQIPFHLQNNHRTWTLSSVTLYKWGNRSTERVSHFSTVTQLGSGSDDYYKYAMYYHDAMRKGNQNL